MRIAFICKRRYMGKDVIADRYARLYEIPYQLAARGHDVLGLCLSYHGDPDGDWQHPTPDGSLRWRSRAVGLAALPRLACSPTWMLRELRAFGPDWVIGASDIIHVALGAWCARKLQCSFAADLYDNFESFGMARIPGAKRALRDAVRHAAVVSCTSQALSDHVQRAYGARGCVITLPSTVDLQRFRPADRMACRDALGLPRDALLIGTAGGLLGSRGIATVYRGFSRLAEQDLRVHLVVAGPVDPQHPPPRDPRVHYLGELAHERVAELFAALDLGVVYLRDTAFGRYCFPQKAYEMAACGLDFVAADVGAMRALLSHAPQRMYAADDALDLARALREGLANPGCPPVVPHDWSQLVATLESELAHRSRERGIGGSRPSGRA